MKTTSASTTPQLLRSTTLAWRGCVLRLLLLAALAAWGTSALLQRLPLQVTRFASLLDLLRSVLTLTQRLSLVCIGLYGVWLAIALILWITARVRTARQRQRATPGVLLGIRLPQPVQAGEPHSTTAARGGNADAVIAADLLRALIAALAQLPGQPRLALELWSAPDGLVQWAIWATGDPALTQLIVRMLHGAAPGIEVRSIPDPLREPTGTGGVRWQSWRLATEPSYPLRSAGDSDSDPLGALIGALRPLTGVRAAAFQLILVPTPQNGRWQRWARLRAQATLDDARDHPHMKDVAERIAEKARHQGVEARLTALVIADQEPIAQQQLATMEALVTQYTAYHGAIHQGWIACAQGQAPLDAPAVAQLATRPRPPQRATLLPLPPPIPARHASILVAQEIAAHWHLPSARYLRIARWRANQFLPPDPQVIVEEISA